MEKKIATLGSLFTKHFSAHLDEVELRTGRITERIRIDHPEAAAIVPFADPDHILMVRQWRYAVGRETLEIPAGKVDSGEDPMTCARRELLEETGYFPHTLIELFRYFPAIGYSNEVIRIYAASRLQRRSEHFDEDEISHLETVPVAKVFDMIAEGSIRDGKTVIGISLYQTLRDRGKLPVDFFG